MDGHRLIKLAGESGKDKDMYHRFFTAAMTEKLPIHDHSVLKKLALEIGLDSTAVDEVLEGDLYYDEVEEDERTMKSYGGRGVPFFVINKRYDYSGALAPEILLNALQKTWQETEDNGTMAAQGGLLCGPDGCILPPT
jgi:Predicted dithiol-disulfide isomerase involved in polyketide biosynthesis